jgi:hypothetical protein
VSEARRHRDLANIVHCNILIVLPDGNRLQRRYRRRGEDNIKIDLKETEYEDLN